MLSVFQPFNGADGPSYNFCNLHFSGQVATHLPFHRLTRQKGECNIHFIPNIDNVAVVNLTNVSVKLHSSSQVSPLPIDHRTSPLATHHPGKCIFVTDVPLQ